MGLALRAGSLCLALTAIGCVEGELSQSSSPEIPIEIIEQRFLDALGSAELVEEPTEYEKIGAFQLAIAGDERSALLQHPPSSLNFQPMVVGDDAHLEFALALKPEVWDEPGDGVTFEILTRDEQGVETELYSRYIDPKQNLEQRVWINDRVDLGDLSGDRVQFVLRTTSGPQGDSSFDWAVWGDPRVSSSLNLTLTPSSVPSGAARKNVLVVLIDTLRADHLGFYGYPRNTTPNLDAFLEQSVVFLNARSQASCTFPSVNSILTSRFPFEFIARGFSPENPDRRDVMARWQSGNRPSRFGIPDDFTSLPAFLRDQGYFTAAVSASPIVRNEPSETATNSWGGFGAGFDAFDEQCLNEPAHCVSSAAVSILNGRPLDRPFFLYLHYMDPHGPYGAPESFGARFSQPYSGNLRVAQGFPYPLGWQMGKGGGSLGKGDLQHLINLYDDGIAYFDSNFGMLLAALDAAGYLDTTVVAILSDHGESFLEHQYIAHCQTVFDAEIHTPLAIHVPQEVSSRVVVDVVQNLDFFPTLVDLLGIEEDSLDLEGLSLLPLMSGPSASEGRVAYSAQRTWRSVSTETEKLIYDILSNELRLFDLASDPGELHDVSALRPMEFETLKRLLFEHLLTVEGSVAPSDSIGLSSEVEAQLKALGYLQ